MRTKPGRPPFERAVGPPLRVGRCQEEERALGDEGGVGVVEALAAQFLVQPVRQRAAAEVVL
jgi:hypothetical protein